jgi:hypothetical protein
MKEYEKKEPLSALLRSGALASEEYKRRLFLELDAAIYERIFKNGNYDADNLGSFRNHLT